jgi:drug/metabolite transporter (DMT)-like permease
MPVPGGRSAAPIAGYLLLAAGMALVGSYVALSKPLTAVFPVFLLAWLRFAMAALVMLPWLRGLHEVRPQASALFLQSFFGNFLFSICMLAGLAMTSASAAGVILSTLPAVVALLGWLLLRERLGPRVWGAVALATAGVALLSLARSDAGSSGGATLTGNLLVFGCVICEAVYVILGKRLTATLSPLRISALINAIGLALMTPLGLWQASSFDFATVGPADWLLLAFYAVSASVLSTWLWLSGLQRVPASHSGVFTIAMPLAATAVGVGLLGERVGWAHGAALALACAGIALIASRSGPPPRRASRPQAGR